MVARTSRAARLEVRFEYDDCCSGGATEDRLVNSLNSRKPLADASEPAVSDLLGGLLRSGLDADPDCEPDRVRPIR